MAKPMLMLSEVLRQLQAFYDTHGDVPVLLDDPDTGWPMVPDITYDAASDETTSEWGPIGPCVTFSGGYGGCHRPLLPEQKG